MSELLPCPFCGTKPRMCPIYIGRETRSDWAVLCPSCDISLDADKTETEAADRWNRRATTTDASTQPVGEGWQDISTAPEEGDFLVYIPGRKRGVQVCNASKKLSIIGGAFSFDLPKPTLWHPLPALTTQATATQETK